MTHWREIAPQAKAGRAACTPRALACGDWRALWVAHGQRPEQAAHRAGISFAWSEQARVKIQRVVRGGVEPPTFRFPAAAVAGPDRYSALTTLRASSSSAIGSSLPRG